MSDDLSHSKESVLIFLDALLTSILEVDVKVLHIWSDGPSSQFKNRFVANCLKWFEQKFNLKIHWNFFAASHGKGPVDGIGGTIKRLAGNIVTSRKIIVNDSLSFAKAVEYACKVKVLHVSSAEVKEKIESSGLGKLIKNSLLVPGIFSAHHLEFTEAGVIMHPYTDATYQVNKLPAVLDHADEVLVEAHEVDRVETHEAVEIKNGMFLIIPYDFATCSKRQSIKKSLLALVLNVDNDDIEVQYGKSVGQSLKRFSLLQNDKGYVKTSDVIQVLLYPVLKRGVYEFSDDIHVDIV